MSSGSAAKLMAWWRSDAMNFDETLSQLHALLGTRVCVEVRTSTDLEVATLYGVLATGDDVGSEERLQGVGDPTHDRLLFGMRERPYPEGFYLDRRTFRSAEWAPHTGDEELRIRITGGAVIAVIADLEA